MQLLPRQSGRMYKYRTRPGYTIKDRYKTLGQAGVSVVTPSPTPHQTLPRKEVPKSSPSPALPASILPKRNYFMMKESGINYYWSQAFYKNLKTFTGDSITYTDYNHGLIYYYLVDGQIRYVGQTREKTLKWRLAKPQENGHTGYNLYIKRNLLQAASEGRLRIETRKIPKSQLNDREKTEIETYAPTNRLWNWEHNQRYFSLSNFYQ